MINDIKSIGELLRYSVYTFSDETGECVIEYRGEDFDRAQNAFIVSKNHLTMTKTINKDATVVFKDVYEDKIIDTYNTLDDA